jgi:1,4-alpha-glucan branching enzyme
VNDVADRWPALWRRDADPAGFQWLDADDAEHARFAFARWDLEGAAAVVCIANCSAVPYPDYRVGLPWAGRWEVVVDTASPRWHGNGTARASSVAGCEDPWHGYGSSVCLDLAPVSMVWLAAPSPG